MLQEEMQLSCLGLTDTERHTPFPGTKRDAEVRQRG